MHRPLGSKNVVLLGIGHTHASLIKNFAMSPIEKVNMIGISNFPNATYSGMLPGVLSGQYQPEQMEISLPRLASAAKVPLILESVTKIDLPNRTIHFQDRAKIRYDLLSIATGSKPIALPTKTGSNPLDQTLVSIKPMQTFLQRLEEAVERLVAQGESQSDPVQIDIVGGGLGSVELALCLPPTLHLFGLKENQYKIRLISGSKNPPSGCLASVSKKILKIFEKRKIQCVTGTSVVQGGDGRLFLSNGESVKTDLCLFIGKSAPSDITNLIDVPKDESGFIITNDFLQSSNRPEVWAAGDSGSMKNYDLPKAGVYAVRQGPVMWENLKRWAKKLDPNPYTPQMDFLKLINTGDGSGIGQWKGISFQGKWVWNWKDRIDRKFMNMYQNPPQMMATDNPSDETNDHQMRCQGCGGKVGSASLRQVLDDLVEEFDREDQFSPIRKESSSDDVSITLLPEKSKAAVTSVDTLPSPIEDPWYSGRIAVLHSLSDLWCSGVQPDQIHTSVEVPLGKPIGQQDYLWQVMHGICYELTKHKTKLSGGHSMEGPRLTISVTATGFTDHDSIPKPKVGAQPGDVLILTKGLGTGIVLAGSMQGKGHYLAYQAAIESMLTSNAIAMKLAADFDIHSMTDVTGFGLLGHLTEMLGGKDLSASLDHQAIADAGFPFVEDLINQSVFSTMRENNELFLDSTAFEDQWKNYQQAESNEKSADPKSIALELLLDPQTSGGILLTCPGDQQNLVLKILRSNNQNARVIGEIHKNMTGRSIHWKF